jgi:hypothetical protein
MRYFRFQDPVIKSLRLSYIRARCQAKHRGQCWEIEFDDYLEIWRDGKDYRMPGRGKSDLNMVRKDFGKGWTLDNVEILNRRENLRQRMLKHHDR